MELVIDWPTLVGGCSPLRKGSQQRTQEQSQLEDLKDSSHRWCSLRLGVLARTVLQKAEEQHAKSWA